VQLRTFQTFKEDSVTWD